MKKLQFKKALAKLLQAQILERLSQNHFHRLAALEFQALKEPYSQWKNHHFELVECLTGLSKSSLKRLFQAEKYPDHLGFNCRTKEIFCKALGKNSWEDLCYDVYQEIFKASKEPHTSLKRLVI